MTLSIALLLALITAQPAAAQSSSGTVITATATAAYTVTVPAALTVPFADTSGKPLTVAATGQWRLAANHHVTVAVKGGDKSGAFVLQNGSDTLPYVVKSPGDTAVGGVVADFDRAGMSKVIHVAVPDWKPATTSGDYTGSLVFTIAYGVKG
jgi:hypothetical protein